MNINVNKTEDSIILTVTGRVDTMTSPQLQNEILMSFQKMNKVILDLKGTEYVSSAGLRALLLGQKTAASKGGALILRNVSDTVKSVLGMTGFLDILTLE